MRIRTIMIGTAAARATLIFAAGPASAGEFNGNGDPTQGPTHARSICVFSGLRTPAALPAPVRRLRTGDTFPRSSSRS